MIICYDEFVFESWSSQSTECCFNMWTLLHTWCCGLTKWNITIRAINDHQIWFVICPLICQADSSQMATSDCEVRRTVLADGPYGASRVQWHDNLVFLVHSLYGKYIIEHSSASIITFIILLHLCFFVVYCQMLQ